MEGALANAPRSAGTIDASPLRLRFPRSTRHAYMILIASAMPDVPGAWEQALSGIAGALAVRQFDSLKQVLLRVQPSILLLDLGLPGLDCPRGVSVMRRTNPATKIIVFSEIPSDELEIALFKLGIRVSARRD